MSKKNITKNFRINLLELAEIVRKLSGSSAKKIEYILETADDEIRISTEELKSRITNLCYD